MKQLHSDWLKTIHLCVHADSEGLATLQSHTQGCSCLVQLLGMPEKGGGSQCLWARWILPPLLRESDDCGSEASLHLPHSGRKERLPWDHGHASG